MTLSPHIQIHDISKSFQAGTQKITILNHLSARIEYGETVAMIGPSGSGKSTLLSLLAGLDRPDEGEIFVNSQSLATRTEQELATYRNNEIGIIFQSFELITPFTVLENIQAPLDIARRTDPARLEELLSRTGLTARRNAYPRTLSGGEKQRVAIARALANDPALVLADEPTGSLDQHTGQAVMTLLLEEVRRTSKTLVLITHDTALAQRMDRSFEFRDGALHEIT